MAAEGSYAWFVARAYGRLPRGWFPDDHPIIGAEVDVLATAGAYAYGLLADVSAQARIKTSSGIWLDLSAVDHFGPGNFPRRSGESDASYSARIIHERFRPLATKPSMASVLYDLTGNHAAIFEPATDGGTWDGELFWDDPTSLLGTVEQPWQCYIDIRRPVALASPYTDTWDEGFWDELYLTSEAELEGDVEDAEIERAVLKTAPAGVKTWLRINA